MLYFIIKKNWLVNQRPSKFLIKSHQSLFLFLNHTFLFSFFFNTHVTIFILSLYFIFSSFSPSPMPFSSFYFYFFSSYFSLPSFFPIRPTPFSSLCKFDHRTNCGFPISGACSNPWFRSFQSVSFGH